MLALDAAKAVQTEEPAASVQLAQRIPFASQLREVVRHRPGTRRLPVASLLMGSQARLDSTAFADAVGSIRYGSTPMLESPHAALLLAARGHDGPLSDDELMATAYFAFAKRLATVWGDYFGASTDAELVEVARNFVEWFEGSSTRSTANSGSKVGDGVLVAKVPGSDAYQVVDGHHRVAIAIARGETHVSVQQTWLGSETPLEWHLLAHRGPERSLDQPIEARELARWGVSRNCADRLVRMVRFLEETLDATAVSDAPSYLGVGAGTGWYLRELSRLGYAVTGICSDPLDAEIAEAFHGIAPDALVVGSPIAVLGTLRGPYDVVSCFDLVAAISPQSGRDERTASLTALLRALDARTREVLFVEHADGSDGLGVDALRRLALDATSFVRVVDLGACDDPGRAPPSRLLALAR